MTQKIALVPWGNQIEDYLDAIGVSLEEFCQEMTGGWLFGYVEALKRVDIQTTIFCVSNRIRHNPERYTHLPTGATICVLPSPPRYSAIARRMRDPYGWYVREVFEGSRGLGYLYFYALRQVAAYLSTPTALLAREILSEGCQLILCQEYEYPRFDACVWIGRKHDIPVFASFQGGSFQLSDIERLLRPLTLPACQGLIIATRTETERVRRRYKVPESRIARIFNPLDTNQWKHGERDRTREELQISPSTTVVIWHGRVDIHPKGLDILVRAWRCICDRHGSANLRLLLVGTGNGAEILHREISKAKLENVCWLDEFILDRNAICNYLHAGDIYVFPSRHEGFPVAPIEAMACGLPIVAAAAPGIPDILVEDGVNGGAIVPVEDPDALASALSRLVADGELRREWGKRARSRIEDCFSFSAVGQQLREFLFSAPVA